ERLGEIRSDVGSVFAEHLLYPRLLGTRTVHTMAAAEARLAADAVAMIESGMGASFVSTSILRDAFGVKPAAAFGSSMGELTRLGSLGVWRDGDAAGARLRESPLFRNRLGGRLEAVLDWRRRRSIAGAASAGTPARVGKDTSREAASAPWASYVLTAGVA